MEVKDGTRKKGRENDEERGKKEKMSETTNTE